MGDDMVDDAADHIESIRGQAHKVLDELLGGRRKRRMIWASAGAVGFVAGLVTAALAGGWAWYRGGREL
jgi:hypothetical protein